MRTKVRQKTPFCEREPSQPQATDTNVLKQQVQNIQQQFKLMQEMMSNLKKASNKDISTYPGVLTESFNGKGNICLRIGFLGLFFLLSSCYVRGGLGLGVASIRIIANTL